MTRTPKPGDQVDVRVFRWNGSYADGHFSVHEAWIPGAVQRVDEHAVTIFVYEACERRVYPIESSEWRMVASAVNGKDPE